MNILNLGITNEQIIQYINLGVIAVMLLFALIGFARGLFKSTYYMIATLAVFIVGWMFNGIFCDYVMGFDLSTYNISFAINEKTYVITTMQEFLTSVIRDNILTAEGINVADSLTYAFIYGMIGMIIKIVYFIVLISL